MQIFTRVPTFSKIFWDSVRLQTPKNTKSYKRLRSKIKILSPLGTQFFKNIGDLCNSTSQHKVKKLLKTFFFLENCANKFLHRIFSLFKVKKLGLQREKGQFHRNLIPNWEKISWKKKISVSLFKGGDYLHAFAPCVGFSTFTEGRNFNTKRLKFSKNCAHIGAVSKAFPRKKWLLVGFFRKKSLCIKSFDLRDP